MIFRLEITGKKASFPPLNAKAALAELDLRTCSAFNSSKKPA